MVYEEAIVALVRMQFMAALSSKKEMDIHILPAFTRVDIRDKVEKSVRTIIIERTSNFTDILGNIIYELHG